MGSGLRAREELGAAALLVGRGGGDVPPGLVPDPVEELVFDPEDAMCISTGAGKSGSSCRHLHKRGAAAVAEERLDDVL